MLFNVQLCFSFVEDFLKRTMMLINDSLEAHSIADDELLVEVHHHSLFCAEIGNEPLTVE